jgi:hypothetical protein
MSDVYIKWRLSCNQSLSAQKGFMKFNLLTSGSYSGHGDTCVVGHESEYREDDKASKNAGATVHHRHKNRVPVMANDNCS